MINLNSYYHEILTTFNFSITGYDSIEKKLNDFFEAFSSSTSILGEKHIDFVSFAYSKLIDIEDWKLESTHKNEFFFNTFNEKSSELIMTHDYYAFKDYLKKIKTKFPDADLPEKEKEIVEGLRTSELAAAIFVKPTPYRIILGNKNYTIVRYDQHIDVLTFEIPFNEIFDVKKVPDIQTARNALYNEYEKELLKNRKERIPLRFKKEKNIYKKTDIKSKSFSESIKILNRAKITRLVSLLTNKLIELNQTKEKEGFFNHEISDLNCRYLEGFAKLILSHAYLSLLFDTWIENIPSVVNIDEYKNEKCLGTFIIGYKSNQEITDDERALFRITADRISSNLAAETIYRIYPELRFKRLRRIQIDFLKKFNKEVLAANPVIDHGANALTQENIDEKNKFFSDIDLLTIEKYSLKSFKEFVDNHWKVGATIDKGMFTCFHKNNNSACSIYKNSDSTYNFEKQIKFGDNKEPTLNMVIIQDLIDEISKECSAYNVKLITSDNALQVDFTTCNKISFAAFLQSITLQKAGSNSAGSLGQFMINNYEAFRILGNLMIGIEEAGNFKPLIDFEKDLTPKYNDNGKVEKLEHTLTLSNTTTEIKYRIIFKSI